MHEEKAQNIRSIFFPFFLLFLIHSFIVQPSGKYKVQGKKKAVTTMILTFFFSSLHIYPSPPKEIAKKI